MNTGKKLGTFVCILLLLGFSQSMRAQDFTPQTGAWVINEEANGEPGRGIQIEVQNDILVLYFYGYEPGGDSAFWLATGAFQPGSNEITADLGEYQGGMGFGDPMQNAIHLRSRGQVKVSFSTPINGVICLPDEPCKAISAFNFGYDFGSASALMGRWLVTGFRNGFNERTSIVLRLEQLTESADPAVIDSVSGTGLYPVDGVDKDVSVVCNRPVHPAWGTYSCRIFTAEGDIRNFNVVVFRNRMRGIDSDAAGLLDGFRMRSASSREVIPQ
jgi:hypothetical protein